MHAGASCVWRSSTVGHGEPFLSRSGRELPSSLAGGHRSRSTRPPRTSPRSAAPPRHLLPRTISAGSASALLTRRTTPHEIDTRYAGRPTICPYADSAAYGLGPVCGGLWASQVLRAQGNRTSCAPLPHTAGRLKCLFRATGSVYFAPRGVVPVGRSEDRVRHVRTELRGARRRAPSRSSPRG